MLEDKIISITDHEGAKKNPIETIKTNVIGIEKF